VVRYKLDECGPEGYHQDGNTCVANQYTITVNPSNHGTVTATVDGNVVSEATA
jgi:hypothetical protein